MAQPQATFGTPLSYSPVEFPKAGRNKMNQSASAKDPEHQSQLESAGFVFPEFVGRIAGNFDHVGRTVQEYPLVMHGPNLATALAKNPDHQTELEAKGWSTAPHSTEVKAPTAVTYAATVNSPNPPLSDAMMAELAELRSGHSSKIGDLQVALAAEKKAHAQIKSSLDLALSDKEVLQAQLDKTANRNKAALQKELEDLQAQHDALTGQHAELKMANDQLLLVVGKPAGA